MKYRQPRAITSSSSPAANGAPIPGWKNASRRPFVSSSYSGCSPISLRCVAITLVPGSCASFSITSRKKQMTQCAGASTGLIDAARLDDRFACWVVFKDGIKLIHGLFSAINATQSPSTSRPTTRNPRSPSAATTSASRASMIPARIMRPPGAR